MLLKKREQAQIDKRLIATLTEACEIAKAELIGFEWLTHEVDYARFPASLQVVWVFDTQANKEQALAAGQHARMVDLTEQALSDAGVELNPVSPHVHLDSEEQCQRINGGNWPQRLARLHSGRA